MFDDGHHNNKALLLDTTKTWPLQQDTAFIFLNHFCHLERYLLKDKNAPSPLPVLLPWPGSIGPRSSLRSIPGPCLSLTPALPGSEHDHPSPTLGLYPQCSPTQSPHSSSNKQRKQKRTLASASSRQHKKQRKQQRTLALLRIIYIQTPQGA